MKKESDFDRMKTLIRKWEVLRAQVDGLNIGAKKLEADAAMKIAELHDVQQELVQIATRNLNGSVITIDANEVIHFIQKPLENYEKGGLHNSQEKITG